MVRDFDDLLAALHVSSWAGVSEALDEACDLDADLAEATDEGIVVRINTFGACLEYPFTLRALWAILAELEQQVIEEIEVTDEQGAS
jgi:hypothetical protein